MQWYNLFTVHRCTVLFICPMYRTEIFNSFYSLAFSVLSL